MHGPIAISPSILSADFLNLAQELHDIESAGADWAHIDVMDGHFVPNLTIGVPVLDALAKVTTLPLDVHLMISNPLEQLPWYLEAKPYIATIHYEALDSNHVEEQAREAVSLMRNAGVKSGIAIKPDTPTAVLEPILDLWDMVLVMSVFPGFSGQKYIPESADRVGEVARMAARKGVSPVIQVDGGIAEATAPLVAAQGADCLVAGNGVFKAQDRSQAIAAIRKAATEAQSGGEAR